MLAAHSGAAQPLVPAPAPAPVRRPAPARQAVPSTDAQWRSLCSKLTCVDGWIKLSEFLAQDEIKENKNQGKRYVDGSFKRRPWRSHTGHLPVRGRDWDYKCISSGGGAGNGVLHCSKAFLQYVFGKHYAK